MSRNISILRFIICAVRSTSWDVFPFRKCNVTRTFSLLQAEGEVQALTRRIRLLEEDFDQTETRLQEASSKLEEASKAADESERSVAFFFMPNCTILKV